MSDPTDRTTNWSSVKRELLARRLGPREPNDTSIRVIPRRSHDGPTVPLSFAQQRLWFLNQLYPESVSYNMATSVELEGCLKPEQLRDSFNEVVSRHEALRTTFSTSQAEPVQIIHEKMDILMPMVDLSCLGGDLVGSELERLTREEAQDRFDLVKGPLIRAKVLKIGEEKHVLLLSMHHIVSDGWSIGVLIKEVGEIYEAKSEGREWRLEKLEVQYADYAVWQREWLTGKVLEEQVEYWKGVLKGAPEVLELATDRGRPAAASYLGGMLEIKVRREVKEGLVELSRQHGATLYMTLMGAYKVLLYRYSGQQDIVVGTPIANRNRRELEGLIGFFVNTLVIRTKVEGEESFRGVIRREKEAALGAYEHQDMPFEKLVEEIRPERGLSHTPLCQVVLILDNTNRRELKLSRLKLNAKRVANGTSNFDLVMDLAETEQGLAGVMDYSTDLFDEATVKRMCDNFNVLLEGMSRDPGQRISQYSILTEAERSQLLVDWDNTRTDYKEGDCVHRLFECQVRERPHAPALSFCGEKLSYSQLNARSNQIAHGLRELGVAPSDPVAVLLSEGPRQIESMLGILKAGGVFVCLDPNYPGGRLAQILEDSKPPVLITEKTFLEGGSELAERLRRNSQFKLVLLDVRDGERGEACYTADYLDVFGVADPDPVVTAFAPAYIVYTSGSTGKPKGIRQSHNSFCQFLHWQGKTFDIRFGKRISQWASVSYDAAYCEIFGALCFGATLCLIPAEIKGDPKAIVEWARRERPSLLQVVPSFCRQILLSLDSEKRSDEDCFSDLEFMLLAGEALPVDLARAWLTRFPNLGRLYNLYGPTESVLATYYHVEGIGPSQRSIPIGRAIDGRQILILDQTGQLCPIGVKGEIFIRSPFLTMGYFGRPEETRRSFAQNPLHQDYPDRAYRVGDIGRYLADGNIEFNGRSDNQIKIRGMRVEIEEIESVLAQWDAISECAVAAHDHGGGDYRLAAYAVLKPARESEVDEPAHHSNHVSDCGNVYDEIYSLSDGYSTIDPAISLRAWSDSYDNRPLREDEILESVNRTAERILSLRPRRVLEIGCGTGLLLFRIAPLCTSYCGTDLSGVAIERIQRQGEVGNGRLANVALLRRDALDFAGFEPGSFDAVILSLVVQHFPGMDYLMEVLRGAINVVEPGGFIFFGGLRNLSLLEAFHASVQLFRADDLLPIDQFERKIKQQACLDKDLLVDPEFFQALELSDPKIAGVQIELKRGSHHNEIARFQYDATIFIGPDAIPKAQCSSVDWDKSGLTVSSVRDLLLSSGQEIMRLTGVPNARLAREISVARILSDSRGAETVRDLRDELLSREGSGVDPEEFWRIGDELDCQVVVSWSGSRTNGTYDVMFTQRRAGNERSGRVRHLVAPMVQQVKAWHEYGNNPHQVRCAADLVLRLREHLRKYLPEHMVPSSFTFLGNLPRTPNGKIDRKALPRPSSQRQRPKIGYVEPRTALEGDIARVWQDLLHLDQVGVEDNFFDLGGHSILAMQVVNKLREQHSIDLPVKAFFQFPTIARMAGSLESQRSARQAEANRVMEIIDRIKTLSSQEAKALLETYTKD
jgi:amino acid adenylation domain-containing protein